jgi:hypothetical protein
MATTKTMKPLGRPAIPNEEQKSCLVTVRFTQNELEQIKRNADGRSVSEIIRDAR